MRRARFVRLRATGIMTFMMMPRNRIAAWIENSLILMVLALFFAPPAAGDWPQNRQDHVRGPQGSTTSSSRWKRSCAARGRTPQRRKPAAERPASSEQPARFPSPESALRNAPETPYQQCFTLPHPPLRSPASDIRLG